MCGGCCVGVEVGAELVVVVVLEKVGDGTGVRRLTASIASKAEWSGVLCE